MRFRVALVVPGGVDRSGVDRVIPCLLWLIDRLARQVELHVIALHQEPTACDYLLLGATVHCLPARASRVAVLRALLQLHREFDFDLWHPVWMRPGSLAAAAGALTRRPVLLHINGGDLVSLPDIEYGGRRTRRGRVWRRAAVAGATHITVPSLAMQRAAHVLGIEADVLTLGVATNAWPPCAPRARTDGEPARLLHVASLNRVKDQPTLLGALARLRAMGYAYHADIVGLDTLGGVIQARATDLRLDDVVTFHGAQRHEVVRRFVEQAHVLLISSRHEADPIVALEAAVAGVPTVGTAVGHLVDWAPNAAVTVPIRDANALAETTAALLEDDARRCTLAANAQRRAIAMDADRGASRVLELYDQLIRRKRVRG